MTDNNEISKDVIFDRVQSAIRTFFECPDEIITPQTVALEINGWDSLSHTVFMLELENQLSVKFKVTEVLTFNNVSDVVDAAFSHMLQGTIDHDALHVPKIDKPRVHTDLDFRYPIFEFNDKHVFAMQAGEGFWEELEKSGFSAAAGGGVAIDGEVGSLAVPCKCNPKDTITFYFKLTGGDRAAAEGLSIAVNDKACAGSFKDEDKVLYAFSLLARDYLPLDAVEGENIFRISLKPSGGAERLSFTEAQIELSRWSDGVKINDGTDVLWGDALWRNLDKVGGRPFLSEYNNLLHRSEDGTDNSCDVLVLGDSHALYNFGVYPEIRAHFVAPISVFRLIKDSIDLEPYNIQQRQKVLFTFGEIDCRIIIGSLADRIGPEELIDYLVEVYLGSINTICAPMDMEAAVVLSVPPYPLNVNSDPLFPVVGSLGERVEYTKMFNAKLRTLEGKGCVTGVIDAYTPFVMPTGVMDKYFAADETHLRPDRTDPLFAQVMAWASKEPG